MVHPPTRGEPSCNDRCSASRDPVLDSRGLSTEPHPLPSPPLEGEGTKRGASRGRLARESRYGRRDAGSLNYPHVRIPVHVGQKKWANHFHGQPERGIQTSSLWSRLGRGDSRPKLTLIQLCFRLALPYPFRTGLIPGTQTRNRYVRREDDQPGADRPFCSNVLLPCQCGRFANRPVVIPERVPINHAVKSCLVSFPTGLQKPASIRLLTQESRDIERVKVTGPRKCIMDALVAVVANPRWGIVKTVIRSAQRR
jgi:hypothetical protein